MSIQIFLFYYFINYIDIFFVAIFFIDLIDSPIVIAEQIPKTITETFEIIKRVKVIAKAFSVLMPKFCKTKIIPAVKPPVIRITPTKIIRYPKKTIKNK